MADVTLFGKTFFDLYDYATSNLLLPLGGLAISLFAGWAWGDGLRRSLAGGMTPKNAWVSLCLLWLLRLVTPALVLAVLLQGLGVL
jgi:NSS family neurotransmitter:Na+ symporter